MHQRICKWLVVAFESSVQDPSGQLHTEYDGMQLHIKPSQDEYCNLVSVFLEPEVSDREALTKINRFFSAMAWKDDQMFITRGSIAGGALETDRETPRFNYREKKRYPYGVISRFDFEHLQVVRHPKQQLALALYREGLGADQGFYRFLSFYKIINILRDRVRQQAEWINNNLSKVWDYLGLERLRALQQRGIDIGDYLSGEGRCAIAHAFEQPIRDPDLPDDIYEIRSDTDLMKGLAQVAIEDELGVPSMRKIWREHLYELAGFRDIFGDELTARLEGGQSLSLSAFPRLPRISVRLRGHEHYAGLEALQMEVLSVQGGTVTLGIRPPAAPMQVLLSLDFPHQNLELLLQDLGVDRHHITYTCDLEVGQLRFLKDLYANGILEIHDADAGKRLSHKTAFIPVNIDLRATLQNFQNRIDELLAR